MVAKPYSLRYNRTYLLRTLVFGAVVLSVLIVLEYFRAKSNENWTLGDSIFWTSFFTLGLSYCSYTSQIIVHDFLHLHGYAGRDGMSDDDMKMNLLRLASKICSYSSFISVGVAASFGMMICFLQENFIKEMKIALVIATISIMSFAVLKLMLRRRDS